MSLNALYSFSTVPERAVVNTQVKIGNKFQTLPAGKHAVNMYIPRVSWLASNLEVAFLVNLVHIHLLFLKLILLRI